MASTIVGEMREGSASIKKGQGTSLTFSSVFHFLVVTDDLSVSREEVLLLTPGLPIVGVTYGIIQAICTGIDANRRRDGSLYWDVTCSFDTGREDQRQHPDTPDSPDPTTWLPVFVIDSFETREKVLKKDKSPTPKLCLNSAKTPFADPITETATLCSFTFTQFEDPSQDINDIMDRNDTVNKLEFEGRDPRTLKLTVSSAELGYYVGVPAWRVGYRVTYDRDTWDEVRLDVGPVQLDGESCYDKNRKHKIVGNLNGSGVQVAPGVDPAELTFRKKTEIDFYDFIRVV